MPKKRSGIFKVVPDISLPNYFGEFILTLFPSLYCNFRCDYCYLNSYQRKKLNDFQIKKLYQFIHKVEEITEDKKGRILDLSGGEFFRFIDFDDFMNEFYNNWTKIKFFTNLDYSFDFLKKFKNYPNLIIIPSIHFHQIKNWNEYLKKIDLVIDGGNLIFIRILFEKNQRDKIKQLIEKYYHKFENVRIYFKTLVNFDFDKEFYLKLLQQYPDCDIHIIYNNKEYFLRDFLLNSNLYFKNVICNGFANQELFLNWKGDVFGCESLAYKNKGKLLNIYTDDIDKLKLMKFFICPGCHCKSNWWIK